MPHRNHIPSYRLHRQSGQAITTLTDGLGRRRDVLLGTYGTPASRQRYGQVVAEWEASGRRLVEAPARARDGITINELVLRFLEHARGHYRRADGTATSEVREYRQTARPLCHLYGDTLVDEFGPLALKAVRELMVRGYEHPRHGPQQPLSRRTINQRMGRLRRMFKWAVENELAPGGVYQALTAVRGLQRGRSEARETDPIKPVAEAIVDATLPYLNRHVRAMVEVQRHSGMRPGEVCIMRACNLDMTGPVWLYRPEQHKTRHHGHQRVIAIGPRAQAAIRPFLPLDTRAYLFSPAEAERERREELRARRKTRVQPSQQQRRSPRPQRIAGERYTTSSYEHAIRKGCELAFPPPANLARRPGETLNAWGDRLKAEGLEDQLRAWRKAHAWHPNQLRHSRATEIRRRYGLEAAQVILGHSRADVTQVYAERNLDLAEEIAGEIG